MLGLKIKDHVVVTFLVFGRGYDEVHKWIDSEAGNWLGTQYSPYRHWVKNHNLKALDEKYGKNSVEYKVGALHIICDWLSHLGKVEIPESWEEVEVLLKKHGAWW